MGDIPDALAQFGQIMGCQCLIIQQNLPFADVVHAQQQVGNGSFARTSAANDGHFLTGLQFEAHILQRGNAGVRVSKSDFAELNTSLQILGIAAHIENGRLGIQKLIDPFLRSRCLLYNGGNPADGRHRPGQHVDVDDELGNVARRNRAFDHLQSTKIHHQQGTHADQQQHQRKKQGIDQGQL